MLFFLLIFALFLLFITPQGRCAVAHPIAICWNAINDAATWLRRKEYNRCPSGRLIAYVGLFGKGKTLSAVHDIVEMYKKYDGKEVFCPKRNRFVLQKVVILSNIHITAVPYEHLSSLGQIYKICQDIGKIDDENDTLSTILVLGDEFSVQLNSRSFRDNMPPQFLGTLLTCRHYRLSIFYTAQRFGHVDALLRQVTEIVVDCNKIWRFMVQRIYDAWDMEQAAAAHLLKPLFVKCWFVRNADYANYDTLACVGLLKKSIDKGDMMPSAEILVGQQQHPSDVAAVQRPGRIAIRGQKK